MRLVKTAVVVTGILAATCTQGITAPLSPVPAIPDAQVQQVQYRYGHHHRHYGYNGGWHHRGYGAGAAALGGLAAGAIIGGAIANSQAQANANAYCSQRFRSYDPASGTYLGNDGMRHPCP